MTNKQTLKRWFPYCSIHRLKKGEVRAQLSRSWPGSTGYRLFFPVALREAIEVADIFFTKDQRLILKIPLYGFAPKPYALYRTDGEVYCVAEDFRHILGEISDLIDRYIREIVPVRMREAAVRATVKDGRAVFLS